MPKLKFTFSVDAQGRFTYPPSTHPNVGTPENEWRYAGHDSLTFECPSGPFTLELKEKVGGGGIPFGPVTGNPQGPNGPWVGTVPKIQDGLTCEERKRMYNDMGFVAKYKYAIDVQVDGTTSHDESHAGTHTC